MKRLCLRLALLLGLAAGAAGCMEIREEIWLNQDGTARYALDMGFPEFLLITAVERMGGTYSDSMWTMLGRSDSTIDKRRDYVEEDMHHFVFEREIASWKALATLAAASDTTGPWTDMLRGLEVTSTTGGDLRVRRTAFPKLTQKGIDGWGMDSGFEKTDRGDSALAARWNKHRRSIFANREYRLTLHAPRVVSADGEVSADRGTVTWELPMWRVVGDSTHVMEAILSPRNYGAGCLIPPTSD